MQIDKQFQKMQMQIRELRQLLDSFDVETVQPTVQDCDQLREQLNRVQDELAVFKFQKFSKELSPSFNIHAKVSEKEPTMEKPAEPKAENPEILIGKVPEPMVESNKTAPVDDQNTNRELKPLVIGVNDKFRFINDLFAHNGSEYLIVLEQLGSLTNWHETHVYLNSLRDVYGWKEHNEAVKYFYALVKKRYE